MKKPRKRSAPVIDDEPSRLLKVTKRRMHFPHLATQAAVEGNKQEAEELASKLLPHLRQRVCNPAQPKRQSNASVS